MRTVLDYAEMLTVNMEINGIEPVRLKTDLAEKFQLTHRTIKEVPVSNGMGFLDLDKTWDELDYVESLAKKYRERFDAVVVIGMGGSSLGVQAVCQALLGEAWNLRDDKSRCYCPKVYFLDNLDPVSIDELLEVIDIENTFFNVVSKSGSTAETLALYAIIEDLVRKEIGSDKASEHFLFTTDPSKGALRSIAKNKEIHSLEIPPEVGGRFSVLSSASLFVAALVGLNARRIMKGAVTAQEQCKTPILENNKAGIIGMFLYIADVEQSRNVHVVMPYCDRLQKFSLWLQQLWSESLGKAQNASGELVNSGPTVLMAQGARDQHSQLQLFAEGPENKVILFLTLRNHDADIKIPVETLEPSLFRSLSERGVGELLNLEHQATVESLRRKSRPTMTLELEKLDEEAVGELLMMFMMSTVYAGDLYGVNALGQPGVELGKRLTFELLEREETGHSDISKRDSRWRIGNVSGN